MLCTAREQSNLKFLSKIIKKSLRKEISFYSQMNRMETRSFPRRNGSGRGCAEGEGRQGQPRARPDQLCVLRPSVSVTHHLGTTL